MHRSALVQLSRLAAGSAAVCASTALCHGNHAHNGGHSGVEAQVAALAERLARLEAEAAARYGVSQKTGQGDAVFSWEERLSALPAACRPFEQDMHGGFNEDAETGIVFTGIPGAGLFAISPDLTTWTPLNAGEERLKANIHGLVAFEHGGRKLLAVAQNTEQRVLLLDAGTGEVLQTLVAPRGGEFTCDGANAYYSARQGDCPAAFAVTDVTYCAENGRLYVVTGYCQGDFVLSASMGEDGQWAWGPVAWGGKGDGPGQFRTAHGITAHNGHLYVANREAFQVVQFTPEGALVGVLPEIPLGSRICNASKAKGAQRDAAAAAATPGHAVTDGEGYFYLNALAPLDDGSTYRDADGSAVVRGASRTAPIYAHNGEAVVSVIDAGALGIPVLKHLHHVWPHYVPNADGSKTLHLLVHGWRNGKFAVLKRDS